MEVRNASGRLMARVANIYAAPVFGSGMGDRPCENADWTEVLEDGMGVMGGALTVTAAGGTQEKKERGEEMQTGRWDLSTA